MSEERPTSRSWIYVRILRQLLDALQAAGVPFVVIGGLAAKAYGKRRTTHDIDIFVKPLDARRATEVLEQNGFTTEETYPQWLFKAFKYGVMVDIIFRSEGGIYLDEATWRRARPMEYRGRTLPVVPPEVLMLMKVFALRETRAANTHWRHWRDAVSVLRNVPLDWDFLHQKALELGPDIVLGFLLFAQLEDAKPDPQAVARLAGVVAEQVLAKKQQTAALETLT